MRYYPDRFNLLNDDFFEGFFAKERHMACDIKETDRSYELALNMPGIDRENIHLSLEDGYLNVQAINTYSDEKKSDDGNWFYQERYSGSFQRSFYVGDEVEDKDIHASYREGVLYIEVPKVDALPNNNPKWISID